MKLHICNSRTSTRGFVFKPGYIAATNGDDDIIAASSGWCCPPQSGTGSTMLFVYRLSQNGEWVGSWEGEDTFPVGRALAAVRAWSKRKAKRARK
jgi:hypothetical protein